MDWCEAMNTYALPVDWFSWGLLSLLGFWKLIELGNKFTKWAERKVKNDQR